MPSSPPASSTRASAPSRRRGFGRGLRAAPVLVLALLLAALAGAATYVVDPAAGVDDAARDGSAAQPFRTITYALGRANDGFGHEVRVLPGTYRAPDETFPLRVPANVALRGTDPATTVVLDSDPFARRPTVLWRVRGGDVVFGSPAVSGLTIERSESGPAVQLLADDASGAPALTNLTIRGGEFGIQMLATAETGAAALNGVVERCTILGSGIGILTTAYTVSGQSARVDPTIRNSVIARSRGDGVLFETAAAYGLSQGQRGAAQSAPVVTHATIADNVGSGIYLDNSNLGYRSGAVAPAVTNNILARNGDYALFEYTVSTEPTAFDKNLIGGNLLGFYRDEGSTDRTLLADVPGVGNLDGVPSFVRGPSPDYHLRADSAGVDAALTGRAAFDLDDELRPTDTNGDGRAAPEIGADEVPPCAVTAVLEPAAPGDRCGTVAGPVDLDASASGMTAGFTCMQPLAFTWLANGQAVGTGPTLTHLPEETTRYDVVVSCPDFANCRDTATATVVVHALPTADASAGAGMGGVYATCVAHDAASASVALSGTARVGDPDATLRATTWTTTAGVFTGGASLNPVLNVPNDGTNQAIDVTLTARDSFGCTGSSTARVYVWRGPDVSAGGPYVACQTIGAMTTSIPLAAVVDLPVGSSPARWSWSSTLGTIQNGDRPDASLVILNVPVTRSAVVTVTVEDDHGCQDSASADVTLHPTPVPNPGGPYQQQESGGGTTTFMVAGTSTGPAPTTQSWTTTLGTFQSSGSQSASGPVQLLDVLETGADQAGQVCYEVASATGCSARACTTVSLRNSPVLPPADVGATLRLTKQAASVRLEWTNSPVIPGVADLASRYQVWQSTTLPPVQGTWSLRTDAVPWTSGTSGTDDAALLDVAGPDLVFLKVVSVNDGGSSCADPAAELPDCPRDEDCGNGTDDDQDRRVDCADPECGGIPPCP